MSRYLLPMRCLELKKYFLVNNCRLRLIYSKREKFSGCYTNLRPTIIERKQDQLLFFNILECMKAGWIFILMERGCIAKMRSVETQFSPCRRCRMDCLSWMKM